MLTTAARIIGAAGARACCAAAVFPPPSGKARVAMVTLKCPWISRGSRAAGLVTRGGRVGRRRTERGLRAAAPGPGSGKTEGQDREELSPSSSCHSSSLKLHKTSQSAQTRREILPRWLRYTRASGVDFKIKVWLAKSLQDGLFRCSG